MENINILVEGSYGHYVPKMFVERYDLSLWKGIDNEDIEIIKNPNHEFYMESWDNILKNGYYELDGKKYTLHQDGDLYAIAIDDLSDEELEKFFGKVFLD